MSTEWVRTNLASAGYDAVSHAQLTGGGGGLSLPESTTVHVRPTYLSQCSQFTRFAYVWNRIPLQCYAERADAQYIIYLSICLSACRP